MKQRITDGGFNSDATNARVPTFEPSPLGSGNQEFQCDEFLPETVVSSDPRTRLVQTLKDLWDYRELFRAFVVRDIKVRYKQTALGVIWVVLQPLMASGVFAMIFKQLGAMKDASTMEALLFFMCGIVPWTTFANAVNSASTSMEMNADMIRKIYFPRLVFPAAYVFGTTVDVAIAMAVLIIFAGIAGKLSLFFLIVIVPLLIVQFMTALGLGFFFGALNAQYRDVKYVIPFLLMMGLFVTVLVPLETWEFPISYVLSFNPMASVIESLRAALSGSALNSLLIVKGSCVALAIFLFGLWFFRIREQRILDIL